MCKSTQHFSKVNEKIAAGEQYLDSLSKFLQDIIPKRLPTGALCVIIFAVNWTVGAVAFCAL